MEIARPSLQDLLLSRHSLSHSASPLAFHRCGSSLGYYGNTISILYAAYPRNGSSLRFSDRLSPRALRHRSQQAASRIARITSANKLSERIRIEITRRTANNRCVRVFPSVYAKKNLDVGQHGQSGGKATNRGGCTLAGEKTGAQIVERRRCTHERDKR